MTRPTVLLTVAFVSVLSVADASAQTGASPARITPEEIDAHLRFLSSDHQPSDEYRSDFDLRGAARLAKIVYQLGVTLGNAETIPTWNADAEFKALRDASRKGL